jgi:hypothetical protein
MKEEVVEEVIVVVVVVVVVVDEDSYQEEVDYKIQVEEVHLETYLVVVEEEVFDLYSFVSIHIYIILRVS